MARIWSEGFEHGLPNELYEPTGLSYQWESDMVSSGLPGQSIIISSGRGSGKSLAIVGNTDFVVKDLLSGYSELYFREYLRTSQATFGQYTLVALGDRTSNIAMIELPITGVDANKIKFYVRIAGVKTLVGTYNCQENDWRKIEIYVKMSATVGAYELKIDNISMVSATNVNTGATTLSRIYLGSTTNVTNYHDDIAVNDTSGSVNNSWCGDGSLIGLMPKADGADTDWVGEGYAVAETSSDATTLNITAHGLTTNDVIYNLTRSTYSIVTRVNDNQLTTSSIDSQAVGDIIVLFAYSATIVAGAGTTTNLTILAGHDLQAYDVTVNSTRSNAIRRVVFVGTTMVSLYNYYDSFNGTIYDGAVVASQVAGDSIRTFKVKHHILDSWKTCANLRPNPQLSRLTSNTSNEKTLLDMEELTVDKGIAANSQIRSISVCFYAGDIGTGGSQIIPIIKSGVTEVELATITLPAITRLYNIPLSISPFTNVEWTRSEVDGLQIGVKYV